MGKAEPALVEVPGQEPEQREVRGRTRPSPRAGLGRVLQVDHPRQAAPEQVLAAVGQVRNRAQGIDIDASA